MATSIIKTDTRHSFGTPITITDTPVTVTQDGYFRISCNFQKNNYIIGFISGIRAMAISTPETVNCATYLQATCYVKKGMSLYATSNNFADNYNSASFYPLA